MRLSIFAATVVAAGCQSTPRPAAPAAADDRPLRIRIARAEARRAGGVVELVELAARGEVHQRELALRGLGRVGGADALAALEAALGDSEPRVVAAALHGLGLAAALDDQVMLPSGPAIQRALASAELAVRAAAIEALGRAGAVDVQPSLVGCVPDPEVGAGCALALGRHGRRKLALSAEARATLAAATAAPAQEIRRAATYALAREHEPPADPVVEHALIQRVTDADAETRAMAIAGLARRKAIDSGRTPVEDALGDVDWRVAVEAVRALAATDDAGRALVATSLQRRWSELVKGNAAEAQVIVEALRQLAGKPLVDRTAQDALASLGAAAKTAQQVAPITRGWIECLAQLAAPPATGGQLIESITSCALPDHLRLPLLAEIVTRKLGESSTQRAAMRALLGHDDARVRAAGLGALPATWTQEAKVQQTIITTITSALASKNPIVAGSAIEAATELYELTPPPSDAQRAILGSAIAARAAREVDVELVASLYELIGKRAIAEGSRACRAGLGGHPVRANAARACLQALGEEVPVRQLAPAEPPPGDIAEVIGRTVTWQLDTSRGAITIELAAGVAPWSVAAIVALTRRGFYDGLELHRVVPNFVAQGGDPTMSGWGGPGFTLPAEPASGADGAGFVAGGVGIADAGPDSGGSQWFVMHARAPHLDGRYTWIGSVISGQKSADALLIGDRVVRATVTIK